MMICVVDASAIEAVHQSDSKIAAMKKCLACQHENSDEMNFCLNCGKPLAETRAPGWLGDATPQSFNEAPTQSFIETPTTVRRGSFETTPIPQQFASTPRAGTSNRKLIVAIS